MPPFQYQQYQNPYVATIADLMQRQGETEAARAIEVARAQSAAAANSGQIWAGTIGNMAQSIGRLPLQLEEAKLDQQKQRLVDAEVQQRQQQLRAADRVEQAKRQVSAFANDPRAYNEDGTLNLRAITEMAGTAPAGMVGPMEQPDLATMAGIIDPINESLSKARQAKLQWQEHQTNALARIAAGVKKAGDADGNYLPAAQMGAATALRNGLITQDQANQFLTSLIERPEHAGPMLDALIQQSTEKPIVMAKDTQLVSPIDPTKVLASNVVGEKPTAESNIVYKDDQGVEHPVVLKNGRYFFGAKDVTEAVTRPAPQEKDSSAAMDKQWQDHRSAELQAKGMAKGDADAQAYKERKTMVSTNTFNLNAPVRAEAKNAKDQARLDRSFNTSQNDLEQLTKPIRDTATRYARFKETMKEKGLLPDSVLAPEFLQITSGGFGSGLRMSDTEINRINNSKDAYQTLMAAASRYVPGKSFTLSKTQREQMTRIVGAFADRVQRQFAAAQDARQALVDADTPEEHRQIMADVTTKIEQILNPPDAAAGGKTPAGAAQPAAPPKRPAIGSTVTYQGKQYIVRGYDANGDLQVDPK